MTEPMPVKSIRRLLRADLPPDALRASAANDRIALGALRLLVERGIIGILIRDPHPWLPG